MASFFQLIIYVLNYFLNNLIKAPFYLFIYIYTYYIICIIKVITNKGNAYSVIIYYLLDMSYFYTAEMGCNSE